MPVTENRIAQNGDFAHDNPQFLHPIIHFIQLALIISFQKTPH